MLDLEAPVCIYEDMNHKVAHSTLSSSKRGAGKHYPSLIPFPVSPPRDVPGVVDSEAPVHLELTRAPLCPRARLCMYRLPSTVSQGRLGARPRLTISSQSSMLVDRDGDRGAQGDVIVLEV